MGMITPSGGWDQPVQRPQAPPAIPVVYAPQPQMIVVQMQERPRSVLVSLFKAFAGITVCAVLMVLQPIGPIILAIMGLVWLARRNSTKKPTAYVINPPIR